MEDELWAVNPDASSAETAADHTPNAQPKDVSIQQR